MAQDTGTKIVSVYTGSLTAPGGDADSYLAFMRYNVNAIVSALKVIDPLPCPLSLARERGKENMYPHTHHIDNQPILDVHKLNVRYNGRFALEDISFHLHVGERVAVVGPNGAGKSTLFKVVAGVLQPPAAK